MQIVTKRVYAEKGWLGFKKFWNLLEKKLGLAKAA